MRERCGERERQRWGWRERETKRDRDSRDGDRQSDRKTYTQKKRDVVKLQI